MLSIMFLNSSLNSFNLSSVMLYFEQTVVRRENRFGLIALRSCWLKFFMMFVVQISHKGFEILIRCIFAGTPQLIDDPQKLADVVEMRKG